MSEILCYQHGLYPRSEDLVAATRDVDRGRRPAAAVIDQRESDRRAFVTLQREAGLDHVSSGFLSSQDLTRPLVDACAGLATGPLTRWFDNNTFIRTPVVRGELAFDRASFAAEDSEVGLLPGPYTFSRLAGTDLDRNTLMAMLTQDVLRPAAAALVARGARILHLQEPWLVAHGIEVDDWSYLADALRLVRDGLDAQMVVHTYFGNAAPWLDRLQMLPVDAIGVDLTETDVASLERPWPVGILLGCLDGRSSMLEEVDATVVVARHVVEVARPPVLLLSSSCDLELLPRTLADRKVQVLGEAALRLRQELGC